MGRFARKITEEQKTAAIAAVLEHGRTRHDVAHHGIPGILPPDFITPATVGQYVRNHQDRVRRLEPEGMRQALEETTWNLLEDLRAAQQRYRTRNGKKTGEELRQIAAAARELQRLVEAQSPKQTNAPNQTTEETDHPEDTKPATLADQLAQQRRGGNGANGAVQSEACADGQPAEPSEIAA